MYLRRPVGVASWNDCIQEGKAAVEEIFKTVGATALKDIAAGGGHAWFEVGSPGLIELKKPVVFQESFWNRHIVPADPFVGVAGQFAGSAINAVHFFITGGVAGGVEKAQVHMIKFKES